MIENNARPDRVNLTFAVLEMLDTLLLNIQKIEQEIRNHGIDPTVPRNLPDI